MIMQQETYQIVCLTKHINLLLWIYQDKQMRVFSKKLIWQENWKKMIVQQCILSLKSCSKLFFGLTNCNRIIQVMEHQKALNLLNDANNSKFVIRKWNIVNDHSNAN